MSTPFSSPLLPDARLAAGAARLATRYAGRSAPETVLGLLADSCGHLAEHARVRTHPVVLAERLTAERPDALAHTQGPTSGRTRVLSVCSHNAGRSQTAAALPTHRAGEHVTVSPAGTHPADEVEPHIAQALTEAGADLSDASPKPLTEDIVEAADIVITTGFGDARPVVPDRPHLGRPVADPDGAPIAVARDIRDIRDAIDARITEPLTRLTP
ncbi:low molecular weight phosphatase family protein [Streptomyces sp. NPDC058701]|uniref:arsenate-mycothiol transferase ArsC n=1 Tax=Streptomyces sp. NPDC058701 TaxID=3346608 RepID=UPI00366912E1